MLRLLARTSLVVLCCCSSTEDLGSDEASGSSSNASETESPPSFNDEEQADGGADVDLNPNESSSENSSEASESGASQETAGDQSQTDMTPNTEQENNDPTPPDNMYSSDEEAGVRCGVSLAECDVGTRCCVSGRNPMQGECSSSTLCAGLSASFECDDNSDCSGGQLCCVELDQEGGPIVKADSRCREVSSCAELSENQACSSRADCSGDNYCCDPTIKDDGALAVYGQIPLDIGVCVPADQCESLRFY